MEITEQKKLVVHVGRYRLNLDTWAVIGPDPDDGDDVAKLVEFLDRAGPHLPRCPFAPGGAGLWLADRVLSF